MPAFSFPDPTDRRPFLPIVIHPQSGTACYADRSFPWPDEGFPVPVSWREDVTIWPVPRIREARLVDCGKCNKTGIQPQTVEAAARYIPGAEAVIENGTFAIRMNPNPAIAYPTGSGEDEDVGHPVS